MRDLKLHVNFHEQLGGLFRSTVAQQEGRRAGGQAGGQAGRQAIIAGGHGVCAPFSIPSLSTLDSRSIGREQIECRHSKLARPTEPSGRTAKEVGEGDGGKQQFLLLLLLLLLPLKAISAQV